jgi:hypothetical protein
MPRKAGPVGGPGLGPSANRVNWKGIARVTACSGDVALGRTTGSSSLADDPVKFESYQQVNVPYDL